MFVAIGGYKTEICILDTSDNVVEWVNFRELEKSGIKYQWGTSPYRAKVCVAYSLTIVEKNRELRIDFLRNVKNVRLRLSSIMPVLTGKKVVVSYKGDISTNPDGFVLILDDLIKFDNKVFEDYFSSIDLSEVKNDVSYYKYIRSYFEYKYFNMVSLQDDILDKKKSRVYKAVLKLFLSGDGVFDVLPEELGKYMRYIFNGVEDVLPFEIYSIEGTCADKKLRENFLGMSYRDYKDKDDKLSYCYGLFNGFISPIYGRDRLNMAVRAMSLGYHAKELFERIKLIAKESMKNVLC